MIDLLTEQLPHWQGVESSAEREAACSQLYKQRNRTNNLTPLCSEHTLRLDRLLASEYQDFFHNHKKTQRGYRSEIKKLSKTDLNDELLMACQLYKWHLTKIAHKNPEHELKACPLDRLVDSPTHADLAPAVAEYIDNTHLRTRMIKEHQFHQRQWQGWAGMGRISGR